MNVFLRWPSRFRCSAATGRMFFETDSSRKWLTGLLDTQTCTSVMNRDLRGTLFPGKSDPFLQQELFLFQTFRPTYDMMSLLPVWVNFNRREMIFAQV